MEPAGNRREHPSPLGVAVDGTPLPQWSPPVIGGSTGTYGGLAIRGNVPQWSPPVIGGSTARRIWAV